MNDMQWLSQIGSDGKQINENYGSTDAIACIVFSNLV